MVRLLITQIVLTYITFSLLPSPWDWVSWCSPRVTLVLPFCPFSVFISVPSSFLCDSLWTHRTALPNRDPLLPYLAGTQGSLELLHLTRTQIGATVTKERNPPIEGHHPLKARPDSYTKKHLKHPNTRCLCPSTETQTWTTRTICLLQKMAAIL